MALNALRRYDPDKGTALPTYLIGQLQGIKRVSRNQATGIKVPERDVRNAAIVSQKEAEFEDMHGYSPSVSQLADFSGLSEAKIDQIRSMSLPLHSTFFDNSGGEDESSFSPSIRNTAKEDMWKRIVYHDLDPINQKIMEWTMGIGGNPILQTQDIARRLRLSQGAISQRRKKIQDLLDKVG
jgi:DNA-directed RNA polymerase specialized sigma subunit